VRTHDEGPSHDGTAECAVSQSIRRERSGVFPLPTLAWVQHAYIRRVLVEADGNVSEAARRLGLHRRSLQRMLRKTAPTT
jgi:ActR/RegA family two-component response regulator